MSPRAAYTWWSALAVGVACIFTEWVARFLKRASVSSFYWHANHSIQCFFYVLLWAVAIYTHYAGGRL